MATVHKEQETAWLWWFEQYKFISSCPIMSSVITGIIFDVELIAYFWLSGFQSSSRNVKGGLWCLSRFIGNQTV